MNRIRELRAANGIQQKDLARMLNVAENSVSRYEKGQRDLGTELINRLCDIFGCTADYLLCRSDFPAPQLSRSEEQMLLAYRSADLHTRELVDLALQPFAKVSSLDTAAG